MTGNKLKVGSKGISCQEFVNIMRERGFRYDEKKGGFLKKTGKKPTKFLV